MQNILGEMGVSMKNREFASAQTKNCLEDTCARNLEEYTRMKESLLTKIADLKKLITSMAKALDCRKYSEKMDNVDKKMTLVEHAAALKVISRKIEQVIDAARERRDVIINDIEGLKKSIQCFSFI